MKLGLGIDTIPGMQQATWTKFEVRWVYEDHVQERKTVVKVDHDEGVALIDAVDIADVQVYERFGDIEILETNPIDGHFG